MDRGGKLTHDPGRRAGRVLTAAGSAHQAGEPETALRLLSIAAAGPLDQPLSAQIDELRAQVAFATNGGSDAAVPFLRAAAQFQRFGATRARDNYLDAMAAAMSAGPEARSDGRAHA